MLRALKTGLFAAAVLAAALAGASSAAGGGARTARVEVPAGAKGSATAVCPKGARALSGGFAAPGFRKQGSALVRIGSRRAGRAGWRLDAASFEGQGAVAPRPAYALVYCARGVSTSRVSRSVKVRYASAGRVSARCPRGRTAISGGFATRSFNRRGGPSVVALTSRRKGTRAWRVEGVNFPMGDGGSGGRTGILTAFAYCRRGAEPLIRRSARAKVEGDSPRGVRVRCPRGARAVSGGFDGGLDQLIGPDSTASGAVESVRMRRARGWRISAVSVSDGGAAGVTAFAYCERR